MDNQFAQIRIMIDEKYEEKGAVFNSWNKKGFFNEPLTCGPYESRSLGQMPIR